MNKRASFYKYANAYFNYLIKYAARTLPGLTSPMFRPRIQAPAGSVLSKAMENGVTSQMPAQNQIQYDYRTALANEYNNNLIGIRQDMMQGTASPRDIARRIAGISGQPN